MERNILKDILNRFDHFIKNVDFDNLPERDSEDYRELLMQTANDGIFCDGRYSANTEYTLEVFENPDYASESRSLVAINALSEKDRVRFRFYLDLKDMCYPLFRGKKTDWSAWPWNMTDGESSLDNKELYAFITDCKWPNLSAAILYDIHMLMMNDEENYTSVARNEVSMHVFYGIKSHWGGHDQSEEKKKKLIAAIGKCADDLWAVENHMKVGRLVCKDMLELSLYDAMDTFIDSTFRYQQVLMASEMAAWIRENWTIGERHPEKAKEKALWAKLDELKAKYDVKSPDMNHTCLIIAIDILQMSMFSEEEENFDDDDEWIDESDEDKTE